MTLSLPRHADLEHLRRDARRLQRGVRDGDEHALALVARHHPEGVTDDSAEFALSDAHLVVARAYGFASWPGMLDYLRSARPLWRDPAALDPSQGPPAVRERDPAALVAALACLTYTDRDEPARWVRATDVLDAHPGLAQQDVVVAAVAGDAAALSAHLAADPGAAMRHAGPFRWPPLLYLVYSRIAQRESCEAAQALLDGGADPDSGYLWQGLPTPFTALTGVFGEGEQGRGRAPRHPRWHDLAELLLDRGADPNDRQALYNRMFNRDDSHLELLLERGLGRPSSDVWTARVGSTGETLPEMMQRQLRWAQGHGFTARLELLARYGFRTPAPTTGGAGHVPAPLPAMHRAATPDAVRRAAADGADVDARHDGRTALHQAAFLGDDELVTALLDVGADATALDATHASTPEGWAEWARHDEVARLLRDRRG